MISERMIWRAAHWLIEDFCDDAPIHAAQRADVYLADGDLDGYRTWLRVLEAVKEIRDCAMPGQWIN